MKATIVSTILALCSTAAVAQIAITGSAVTEVSVPASMGYTTVYVVRDTDGARLSYTASHPGARWERWDHNGAAYAEPVTDVLADGNTSSIDLSDIEVGAGFTVTDPDGTPRYLWVINYEVQRFLLGSVDLDLGTEDCARTRLLPGLGTQAGPITAYSINGRSQVIDRDIIISYQTLTYNADSGEYMQTEATASVASITGAIYVDAPLCDTRFTISPDRFTREWYPTTADVQTASYTAIAVDAHTSAEQRVETSDNEQSPEGDGGTLGGSAPCEITFRAAVSDAAIYRRWEISLTPDFADSELQYDQLEFTHTFTEAGTRYVRFTADNAAGTCPYEGETYTVNIGESRLLCPNAFSPGASEGVNDEWRVSYRSIVDFDCQIFNRWGKRLATLTHPSQGWDGKVGGKVVPSGVYYYVIKARGADGKEYKLAGDINIINSRRGTGTQPVE